MPITRSDAYLKFVSVFPVANTFFGLGGGATVYNTNIRIYIGINTLDGRRVTDSVILLHYVRSVYFNDITQKLYILLNCTLRYTPQC